MSDMNKMRAKAESYAALVNTVKNCPKLDDCNKNGGVQLRPCDFCNEINLWSYWQGGIEHLDADILLVGQDWGDYACIKDTQADLHSIYLEHEDESITDKNLSKLFKVINPEYKLMSDENIHNDLFFTNFVICYRYGKLTGGFKKRWCINCAEYFRELACIIEPKVILCLGRNVFEGVLKAAGNVKKPKGSYNDIIEGGPVKAEFGGRTVYVFPLAHCGEYGTWNRNGKKNKDSLELQKQDWSSIKEYL